ncbi:MAG: hypothetical protein ACT4OD_04130 [Candidatus Nitrosotenuis sp.]
MNKVRIRKKAEAYSLRRKLYDYTIDLDEVENSQVSTENWNNVTHYWCNQIKDYKFEDVVYIEDLEIPDCFDQLVLWSNFTANSEHDRIVILDHVKFLLDAIIYVLPGTFYRFSKYDVWPIASYAAFLVPFYFWLVSNSESILYSLFAATLFSISFTFVCKRLETRYYNKHLAKITASIQQRENPLFNQSDESQTNDLENMDTNYTHSKNHKVASFVLFSAVFSFIASLAITEVLTLMMGGWDTTFSEYWATTSCTGNQFCYFFNFVWNEIFVLGIAFFAVGILFYHCGIVFLATEATDLIQKHTSKTVVFASSVVLFIEGLVLFFLSHSVDNLQLFSFWILALMGLDILWVFLNLFKNIDTLFQWLHFDFAILLFGLGVMSLTNLDKNITMVASLFVFVVLTARTIFDYNVGWDFWTKFIPKEG